MEERPAALTPRQVADLLAAAAATLRAELTALPEATAGWHPAPGEWCAKEVLGHLIEAERRGFAGRVRAALAEPAPAFAAWDMAAVARARADCARELAVLLDEFDATRQASVVCGAETSSSAIPAKMSRLRSSAPTRCSATVPSQPAMIATGAAAQAVDR